MEVTMSITLFWKTIKRSYMHVISTRALTNGGKGRNFTNVTRQFICRLLLSFTKSCKQLVWRQITSLVWGMHCDSAPGSRSRWVQIDFPTRSSYRDHKFVLNENIYSHNKIFTVTQLVSDLGQRLRNFYPWLIWDRGSNISKFNFGGILTCSANRYW